MKWALLAIVPFVTCACAAGDDPESPDARPADTGARDSTADSDATIDSTVDSAVDSSLDSADASDTLDATSTDATDADGEADAGDSGAPYRHTITVDGTNDFDVADKLTTTSTGYDAYVTWDATSLYVGYYGVDIGSGATTSKWVFVYIDVDPSASTGATTGEQYNHQRPKFPTGFSADYYYAWKTDDSYAQFKKYATGAWSTATSTIAKARDSAKSFVDIKIPLADLGSPTKFSVVTMMMNEATSGEWSYAGLFSGSYTDGYYPASSGTDVPIKYWLQVDLASSAAPSALANRKP